MSKLAIICPHDKEVQAAAEIIAAGARAYGAEADIFDLSLDPGLLALYDAAAFGLGDGDNCAVIHIFSQCLTALEGKKAAVFGNIEGGAAQSLMLIGKAARCVMLSPAGTPQEAEALGRALMRGCEMRPDLAGTVPVIFSTITGNAYKLAAAAAEAVPDRVGPYNIRYITHEVISKFDTFVLCYWCNHGTADDDTIELIGRMRGKKLIVIGSLGVSTDTAHAAKVCENVIALASEHNTLLGHYLCRGSIDLRRTFARTRIPQGEKGHLSMERFEKQKQSLGHPDAEELEGARAAVAEFLKKT